MVEHFKTRTLFLSLFRLTCIKLVDKRSKDILTTCLSSILLIKCSFFKSGKKFFVKLIACERQH